MLNNDLKAKLTWAARTWRDRFDAWLQDDRHEPKVFGWTDEITYLTHLKHGDLVVRLRTLSQMSDTRAEDYRNQCIKDAMGYLDSLGKTPVIARPRRRNFLHEMGR